MTSLPAPVVSRLGTIDELADLGVRAASSSPLVARLGRVEDLTLGAGSFNDDGFGLLD